MSHELGLKNLDIYVTGKCNYKCGYCYGENDTVGAMELSIFNKAIEFAKYIKVKNIQICGGEPLVCSDIENYISMAKENGFGAILRTNGILVHKHLKFIADNCKWVGISIDGLPDCNAKMRTPRFEISPEEQFNIPIQAIIDLKKENPNIKIILASLVSIKNADDIPNFANYLIENKVPIDKWKIYEFICDKFRSSQNRAEYEMTENEFLSMIQKLPKDIDGAPIQAQSAHTKGVSANCLIVYQNGDINLSGKHYGNVNIDPFENIIENLLNDDAIQVIKDNKEVTYNDK